jgi:hypothetical protein
VVTVSDQFSTVELSIPFEPAIWYLNGDNNLHLGMIQNDVVINSSGTKNLSFAEAQLNVESVTDSAYFRVDHYWVAPDAINDPDATARLSQNHYWRIDGIWAEGFSANATLTYNGILRPELDAGLTAITEDSLILAYRAHGGEDWVEYWNFEKVPVIPGDGRGFIFIQDVQPGEYAFSNGVLASPVSVQELKDPIEFTIYPNPGDDFMEIQGDFGSYPNLGYRIYTVDCKLIQQSQLERTIYLSDFKEGMYILQLLDNKVGSLGTKIFEVFH